MAADIGVERYRREQLSRTEEARIPSNDRKLVQTGYHSLPDQFESPALMRLDHHAPNDTQGA